MEDCEDWYKNNIHPNYKNTAADKYQLLKCSFEQLSNDHITLACMNFGIKNIELFGGIQPFIKTIQGLNKTFAPDCTILPELGIQRQIDLDKVHNIDEIINSGFFYSIDLNGNEKARSVYEFRQLYLNAKKANLVLKAHVGEFGTPDDIIEAIEVLNLSEINHGVCCVNSNNTLDYIKKRNVILHISPTSNVRLGVFNSLYEHPIGKIFRCGIPVTICSDDQLIFDSEISKEFIRLYKSKILEKDELQIIWNYGLNYYQNKPEEGK